jgi:hypothetical protein
MRIVGLYAPPLRQILGLQIVQLVVMLDSELLAENTQGTLVGTNSKSGASEMANAILVKRGSI